MSRDDRKIRKKGETIRLFVGLRNLKVLVVGDAIIDEYVFALPKARAVKDPILSTEYKGREFYAGGALAIANHVAGFIKKVDCLTIFGSKPHEISNNELRKLLKPNVSLKAFIREGAYTTLKKRYVSPYRYEKLFKNEYITDTPINDYLSKKINRYLKRNLPKYDLVLVADFGHGFLNQELRLTVRRFSRWLSVNSQNNSSNSGYNYFTNYFKPIWAKTPDFMTMTEEEARLPLEMRWESIKELANEINRFGIKQFIITRGKLGSTIYSQGKIINAKAPVNKPVDTMGAGDALFAITSLLAYKRTNPVKIVMIGNLAGGYISKTLGNKVSITPEALR